MFIGFSSAQAAESFGESFGIFFGNSKGNIKCVFLNNRPCQTRSTLVNINSNEPLYYLFTVSVIECGGSCNTIDDPYVRVCVPNKVKYMNVKVFKLMSSVNEIRFLVLLKSCQCKCTLTESGYNSKQKWNHDECRHECK